MISELVRDEPPYRALGGYRRRRARRVDHERPGGVAFAAGAHRAPSCSHTLACGPASSTTLRSASDRRHISPARSSRARCGLDVVHVPFRRLSDSFVELMLGQGPLHRFRRCPAVLAAAAAEGRLRALAVMTRQRSPALPGVPAIAESRPAGGAVRPLVRYRRAAGHVAAHRRAVARRHRRCATQGAAARTFVRQGAESTLESTPDGFMRFMQEEYLRYQAYIRSGAMRPDY